MDILPSLDLEKMPTNGLPYIFEKTKQSMVQELGMAPNQSVKPGEPADRRKKMAVNVFVGLKKVSPDFTQTLLDTLNEIYPDPDIGHLNRLALGEGLAIVIRAYDIETHSNLLERFRLIQRDELTKVVNIIKEDMRQHEEEVLSNVWKPDNPKNLHIPEQEANLRSLVYSAISASGWGESDVEVAAGSMYKILSEFRYKLFSSQPPTLPTLNT